MDDNNDGQREVTKTSRAHYERPAIEQSATFERLQLACVFHAGDENEECTAMSSS